MLNNASRQIIIELKGLMKRYQMGHSIVHALQGVDLKVVQGELLAIMGASGSGKSTLLHLLGCLDTPTEGKYLLDQKEVSNLSDNALAEIRANKIGFVFQSFNLIPQLTVFENVAMPFLYQRKEQDKEMLKKMITESLTSVGLAHRINHHPYELSGGEMQRVAIARALATKPLLILADEPTGNLDSENGKSILQLLKGLNSRGVTIIIVTHDPSVAAHCPRLVRMKDGRIIEERYT